MLYIRVVPCVSKARVLHYELAAGCPAIVNATARIQRAYAERKTILSLPLGRLSRHYLFS
jgi:hypothetical protein